MVSVSPSAVVISVDLTVSLISSAANTTEVLPITSAAITRNVMNTEVIFLIIFICVTPLKSFRVS